MSEQDNQTIEQIRKRHNVDCHWIAIYGSSQLLSDLSDALRIVNSQALEIERLQQKVKNIGQER